MDQVPVRKRRRRTLVSREGSWSLNISSYDVYRFAIDSRKNKNCHCIYFIFFEKHLQAWGTASGPVWWGCGTCQQSLLPAPDRSEKPARPESAGTGGSAAAPEYLQGKHAVMQRKSALTVVTCLCWSSGKDVNKSFEKSEKTLSEVGEQTRGSCSHCSLFFISSWTSWIRFRDSRLSSSKKVVSLISMLM